MDQIKKLSFFLKPYKRLIIFTLFLGLFLSGIGIGTAKLVQIIIDEIFVKKSTQMLVYAPAIIIGIYIVAGLVRYAHMYYLRYLGDCIVVDIRNALEKKFTHLSLDFHSSNSSGSLISKTMNDVTLVQQGLTLLADVVREPISLIALLGYMFYTNWQLSVVTILAAPFLIFASKKLGRSVRKYSHVMQGLNERITEVLKETVDGIRVVKSFSLEKHMQEKFGDVSDDYLASRRKILSREELAGPMFELMAAIVFAGILYFAGWQVIRGESTPGGFISFIYVLGLLQKPIKKIQDANVRFQHCVAATERVFNVLETPVTVQDPQEAGIETVQWPEQWREIEFRGVGFSYGDNQILNDVTFKVVRGEMIAIVGPSGAGKSTLVNLIPRFFDPSKGDILIDGVSIKNLSLKDLRLHVAHVTQDVFLFNDSIMENIVVGQSHNHKKVLEALDVAHASQFADKVDARVESDVGDRGLKLSGGERQRISIARAVYKNAPILVLDEATSSLDSESEREVQEALDGLMVGRTTFVIAHRLSTIQKADRILVLAEGKIIEDGTHGDLIQNNSGIYKKLHDLQFVQTP